MTILTFILIAGAVVLAVLYVTALPFVPGDGTNERDESNIRDVEFEERPRTTGTEKE